MDKFEASNGVVVLELEGGVGFQLPMQGVSTNGINGDKVQALREFFQHERDVELGRWRWPENPDYVVYADGTSRRVIRESSGTTMQVSLHDRKVMTTYLDSYVGAARAYDAAHPEPKPWHEAKEGEVWVIEFNGNEYPAIFQADSFRDHGGSWGAEDITNARRIWPEEEQS